MLDWCPDFYLGKGDDKVPMDFPITDQYGAPVDLTGATVQLMWGPKNGAAVATTALGAVQGTTPNTLARYVWKAADTAVPGNYEAVFLISGLPGSERISWPLDVSGRKLQVQVGAPPA